MKYRPPRKSGLTPKTIDTIEWLHIVRPVLGVNPLFLGGVYKWKFILKAQEKSYCFILSRVSSYL